MRAPAFACSPSAFATHRAGLPRDTATPRRSASSGSLNVRPRPARVQPHGSHVEAVARMGRWCVQDRTGSRCSGRHGWIATGAPPAHAVPCTCGANSVPTEGTHLAPQGCVGACANRISFSPPKGGAMRRAPVPSSMEGRAVTSREAARLGARAGPRSRADGPLLPGCGGDGSPTARRLPRRPPSLRRPSVIA